MNSAYRICFGDLGRRFIAWRRLWLWLIFILISCFINQVQPSTTQKHTNNVKNEKPYYRTRFHFDYFGTLAIKNFLEDYNSKNW